MVNQFWWLLARIFLSGDVEMNPGPVEGILQLQDVKLLKNVLWEIRKKWFSLGINLGVSVDTLEAIQKTNGGVDECFNALIIEWLRNSNPQANWNTVVDALQLPTVGETQLAEEIRKDTHSCLRITTKKVAENCQDEKEISAASAKEIGQAASVKVIGDSFLHISLIEGLDEEQKSSLEDRLRTETEDIIYKFYIVCNKFLFFLEDHKIPLERLRDSLSDLKVLKRCDSYKEVLTNVKDFSGMKHIIKEYSNFFDFRPLGYLIELFGTDENKQQLKGYEDEFEQYARRRLCECPSTVMPTTPPDHVKLCVKYECEFTEAKLVDIKHFQCRLSAVLKVPSHMLRLMSVKEGCIELTFVLPEFIKDDVLPLSEDQKSAIVEMQVSEFSCGNYHLLFTGKKENEVNQDSVDDFAVRFRRPTSIYMCGDVLRFNSVDELAERFSEDSWGTRECITIDGDHRYCGMRAAANRQIKCRLKVHPPDRKKFEGETAEIIRQIKDLEAKLKATQSDNTAQNIIAKLSKLQAELGETERMRSANKTEVKKIEERLRSLEEEVMKKKNKVSSLLAGMRCNSESKIDEKIREFTKAKDVADKMRSEQYKLGRRDFCCCRSNELKERKGGMGGMKANQLTNDRVHPPDKKKFERETAEITRQIKDLEAKLKATQSDNTAQNIIAELSKLQAELGETERTRLANKIEVKKIEERLMSLREEVIKKKNEASSLLAGMRCNSESKIDEIISKLRGVMLTRQLSDSDQRKYKHEIESLEKSKVQLREFTKAKDAAEKMRSEQDELRRRRDSCYCCSNELKEREVKIKDRMSELRAALDNAREKKREVSALKDSISKDINVLYDRRRELHVSFREQQTAYQAAYQEERRLREEEERKRRENRQALKVEKFKRKLDQEMLRAIHYDEDIAIAKALISHLQANISGASSYLLGGEGESPSSSTTNLDVPEGAAAAGGVVSTRDSAVNQKPGEFVRKKDTEEEVLVPARWTTVQRRSKWEKRKSTVPKPLNFNPAIFHQFSHLGVQPPSSHAEISAVILKLQEKVAFFESKRNPAYSEAGDSGVGGMTDAEISQVQSVATSQEDLHLITVSPNTSVTDLKLPASYPLLHPQGPPSPSHPPQPQPTDNSGDLSDNESSRTVVEDDESSTPRSNSSLMALAIATASS